MKRCPNCNFPNIDSDPNCFKCGTLLPDEEAEASIDTDSASNFNTDTNVTAFIHTPTEDTHPKLEQMATETEREICTTTEMSLPEMPVPPLTSQAPTLPTPSRILPKYKSLTRLAVATKLIGLVLGLIFILLSTCCLLLFPSIFSIALCILGIGFGIVHILTGFVIAALLSWLNDAECNQRKQLELINHIYHKLP